jgi:hypothetical protein
MSADFCFVVIYFIVLTFFLTIFILEWVFFIWLADSTQVRAFYLVYIPLLSFRAHFSSTF